MSPSRVEPLTVGGALMDEDEKAGLAPSRYVLIFDGECQICRRSIDWVHRSSPSGLIETLPYQDPAVLDRFSDVPPHFFEQAIQLITPEMGRLEGARAVEELARVIPATRWMAPLLRLPGVRWLSDRVYRTVARNRRRFGCGDHCSIRSHATDRPH